MTFSGHDFELRLGMPFQRQVIRMDGVDIREVLAVNVEHVPGDRYPIVTLRIRANSVNVEQDPAVLMQKHALMLPVPKGGNQ